MGIILINLYTRYCYKNQPNSIHVKCLSQPGSQCAFMYQLLLYTAQLQCVWTFLKALFIQQIFTEFRMPHMLHSRTMTKQGRHILCTHVAYQFIKLLNLPCTDKLSQSFKDHLIFFYFSHKWILLAQRYFSQFLKIFLKGDLIFSPQLPSLPLPAIRDIKDYIQKVNLT